MRKIFPSSIQIPKQQLYLELAIYYCYNQFVKHCEKIVQKIINDLGTFEKPEDITIQKKLHPIVFPNPYYYSQENCFGLKI